MEVLSNSFQFEQIKHDFVLLRHEIENIQIESELLIKVNETRRYFFKAFKSLKEINILEAKKLIEQGKIQAEQLQYSVLASNLILSTSLPITAYYEYKSDNYYESKNYLLMAIKNENYLINNGFDLLEYRKIEFFINIARVNFKQGSYVEASKLISKAILYLIKFNVLNPNW